MNHWKRRYLIRFISSMVGYSILLPLSLVVVGGGRVEQPWVAILVVLMPVIPFLNAMTAVLQNVRSQDELFRRIQLEAVLVTALLVGALTFSYGLLEITELVPPFPTVFIAPLMITVWGIANVVISRRYS